MRGTARNGLGWVLPDLGRPREALGADASHVAALMAFGVAGIAGLRLAAGRGHASDGLAAASINTGLVFLVGVFLVGWIGNALGRIRVRR